MWTNQLCSRWDLCFLDDADDFFSCATRQMSTFASIRAIWWKLSHSFGTKQKQWKILSITWFFWLKKMFCLTFQKTCNVQNPPNFSDESKYVRSLMSDRLKPKIVCLSSITKHWTCFSLFNVQKIWRTSLFAEWFSKSSEGLNRFNVSCPFLWSVMKFDHQ